MRIKSGYRASEYTRDLYNDFSCLTPIELLGQVRNARLSLVSAMALRVCADQVSAARDIGDQQSVDEYDAVRLVMELIEPYPDAS